MIELVLDARDNLRLRNNLLAGDGERCAILFANQTIRPDETVRLLVKEIVFARDLDYTRRGQLEAELKPEFVANVTKRARKHQFTMVFVHSHPGSKPPNFSSVDDQGEIHLFEFLQLRHPDLAHSALVLSDGGCRSRKLGGDEEVRVIAIGEDRDILSDTDCGDLQGFDRFDRQIRAFGAAGQETIQELRVAIVGLGGTGSLISQELVHLGVKKFILIDPDVVETTNLNRLAHATPNDLGQQKVQVAARYITGVAGSSEITCIAGDVMRSKIALELLDADLIFGCTDSHGSRAVLQQVAYQYMIPCIDMGVTIAISSAQISHIYGRVQLLAPGLACLTCDGLLDSNEVRRDMMTEFERQADPYLRGVREPAPAVMSLNGTVASLAVTMFLSMITGIPMKGRHLLFNATIPSLRIARADPDPNCYLCSQNGALGRGDSWPLFVREQ